MTGYEPSDIDWAQMDYEAGVLDSTDAVRRLQRELFRKPRTPLLDLSVRGRDFDEYHASVWPTSLAAAERLLVLEAFAGMLRRHLVPRLAFLARLRELAERLADQRTAPTARMSVDDLSPPACVVFAHSVLTAAPPCTPAPIPAGAAAA